PKGLAVIATPGILKKTEKARDELRLRKEKLTENAREAKKKLEGIIIEIAKKLTNKGKLYGSVKIKDIVAAIKDQTSVELQESQISLEEQIKEAKEYKVGVKITEEIDVVVKVKVVAIEE
ncbi:MAG TPA: 50S ribosomal protein L9, partial [Candidatus Peregrinibacteria bacterium]|nr:50S ribosomal protein L9 [Candidatus Peregrinibacteria bacterium]